MSVTNKIWIFCAFLALVKAQQSDCTVDQSSSTLPDCILKYYENGILIDGNSNTCTEKSETIAAKVDVDTLLALGEAAVMSSSCTGEFGGQGNTESGSISTVARTTPTVTRTSPTVTRRRASRAVSSSSCSGTGYGNCENSTHKLESIYAEKDLGDSILIVTNSVPNHCYSDGSDKAIPNTVCENYRALLVPKSPKKTTTYNSHAMGPVGIAKSGGLFYNHISAEDSCNVAAITEKSTFDPCDGHASPDCKYHYHKAPNCVAGFADCGLLGYANDGVPIYGKCSITVNGQSVALTSCYKKSINLYGQCCVWTGLYVTVCSTLLTVVNTSSSFTLGWYQTPTLTYGRCVYDCTPAYPWVTESCASTCYIPCQYRLKNYTTSVITITEPETNCTETTVITKPTSAAATKPTTISAKNSLPTTNYQKTSTSQTTETTKITSAVTSTIATSTTPIETIATTMSTLKATSTPTSTLKSTSTAKSVATTTDKLNSKTLTASTVDKRTTQEKNVITSTKVLYNLTTAAPTLPPALQNLGIESGQIAAGASLTATLTDSTSFVLQSLNDSVKQSLGYTLTDMIQTCTYNSVPCDMEKDFKTIYSPVMGNCYTFNPGFKTIKRASRAGSAYGLKLLLAASQGQYSCTSSVAGFRVVIHENNVTPFPDSQGYSIPLATISSFSLFPQKIIRLGYPYSVCASSQFGNFYGNYSVEACQRECFQKQLLLSCKCADPRYPLPPNAEYCSSEQKLCLDYNQQCEEMLTDSCNCPPPCNETLYPTTLSMALFRSSNILMCNKADNSANEICNGTDDFATVYVYYQDLKLRRLVETARYDILAFLSDIAGMAGILFGLGIITIVEVVILLGLCFTYCLKSAV